MQPLALCLSPHLDDVAFSCAPLVQRLVRNGWCVLIATVFTRSVDRPTGFALACQLDKGLPADCDYMRLRRLEDLEFARRLEISTRASAGPNVGRILPLWWPLAEAPHRGYESVAELFGAVHPDDIAASEVAELLRLAVEAWQPDLVVSPLGFGHHVDHQIVVNAIESLREIPLALYADFPYAFQRTQAKSIVEIARLRPLALPVDADGEASIVQAIEAYATQIPFQFGSSTQLTATYHAALRRSDWPPSALRLACDRPHWPLWCDEVAAKAIASL